MQIMTPQSELVYI